MSSLYSFIIYTILFINFVENKNIYFTQSIYDIWCQENILSNSLFLYPNSIQPGIYRRNNVKSVVYHLIDHHNHGLFDVQTKRIADFYFFILNITRPLDINREYQDIYRFYIQANLLTNQGNLTEQAEIHLHVADSNDNDGVFDLDIYEKTMNLSNDIPQLLFRLHASDADEIHHAQILYECSSFNEIFSLHPLTGELYLISRMNLQSKYEFNIDAYDRHRNNNIKTQTRVKLRFIPNETIHRVKTISNQTIEFKELISSYQILFHQNSNWNLLNIHQPILTLEIFPISTFELFILNNSSINSMNLFLNQNKIYLNHHAFQEYNLYILICFSNRTKCQLTNYDLQPLIDLNLYQFNFKSIESIYLEEDLPIDSFITNFRVLYENIYLNEPLIINYRLLNHQYQFNLHSKTGILRLSKSFNSQQYSLNIQADIYLFNQLISIKTNLDISIREINKYRPYFFNQTLTKLAQLPYQFQAYDFDDNRIIYRLWNCFNSCPFQLNPINGLLTLHRINKNILSNKIYHLQIIAYDSNQPISFETKLNITIDLSSKLNKRSLIANLPIHPETIYLNMGFQHKSASYYLSEDTEINTIIDRLSIEYDSLPLFINNEKENLFYYLINDTSIPFIIDQNHRAIRLINNLDREKQDRYTFEIELKLKSSYEMKFQEIYHTNQSIDFQYSNKYYQKIFITISINDVNDNIPRCDYFHQHIFLYENQIQNNIFQVQAIDPDRGENGTIVYSLLDYHQYFNINTFTGHINAIHPIDREQISSLRLHIIASDQGQQVQLQSLCMTLHMTIGDLNDNTPQFSLENYSFDVFADLPRESIFGQIYAIDVDSTDRLIYSIDSNAYIKINKYTGHLQLQSTLDHLVNQNFNLTVRVSDGVHTNQTWIYIHIKHFPKAQEPILLSEPAYHITINQSLSIGTIITNVYQRLQLSQSSIDFIEIVTNEYRLPFSIDQQGSIRLIDSLTNLSASSYWLSIRLTRYRARPPHSFIYIHLTIREDNFYVPQCLHIYQTLKLYDYSIPYPLARIQAVSLYDHIQLEYFLINNTINENIFLIDKKTGFLQFLPSINFVKENYLLTIRAFDPQHRLSVDCFVRIDHIRRHQLTPKFYNPSIYNIELMEIPLNSKQLRQRLFQVIALLDHQVYHPNLQIRYRIIDFQQDFLINRQTGYVAAKKPLNSSTIYRLNVEAYTVAYGDKWRTVSSRAIAAIKIRVLPMNLRDPSFVLTDESIINIDVLTNTKVGSRLFQFGMNNNHTKWFIMTSQVEYTRYFYVNFQSGDLILLRPIEELINYTRIIELHINVTHDWIHMNIIRVVIHIKNDKFQLTHFSQTDYYSSVSKTIPIGIEIARLTIENGNDNCTYNIHSIERIRSKEFFHIDAYSGSITIIQSLEKSLYKKHLLNIIYYCSFNSYITSTRVHINILDKKSKDLQKNLYRFSQENYLIIFETSLVNQEKRDLISLELIDRNHPGKRFQPDAQIIQGDPLGLFSIDSFNQSLILLDESRARSYVYPIQLTIIDTSREEILNCTVTIFISNVAIQFTCPPIHPSPYLFTYQSLPVNSLDLFTGQQYEHYNSITIHGFDPFTPYNNVECLIINPNKQLPSKSIDFTFEKDLYRYIYHPHEPIHVSIKNRDAYSDPFDITYQVINPNYFQIDENTGLIKSQPKPNPLKEYSLLILAKYGSLITLTRLNILFNQTEKFIYQFQLFKPLVDNYTIGYLNNQNFNRRISSIFSIEHTGRLFIQNSSLILPSRTFYDFFIDKSYIQIKVLTKEIIQCSLNLLNDQRYIGFIETTHHLRKRAFYLLNYNHLFLLDYQHGLLSYQNENEIIENDLIMLIEIENARCLLTIHGVSSIPYRMIRKGDTRIDQSSKNGTLIDFDIVSNYAPIFPRKLYTFSLDITNHSATNIFVGQISAEPYNINRSHLVYQFHSSTDYFIIKPDNGVIEYVSNGYYNKTIERLQIIVRDLIYQENTTIDVIIHIIKTEYLPMSDLIYHRMISEILPPGSIIFEPNISTTQILYYSLRDSYSNMFEIDSTSGQVTLLDYLSDSFYSLKIHLSPINQLIVIQLTILDFNNHAPTFSNLPLNLSISSEDIFVTKLSAYDLDLSDNLNLKYYLLDHNQRTFFSIDSITGLITLETLPNQTFLQLKIGVSDGLHLTINYLPITIHDYAKTPPKFSTEEYVFQYHKLLGQIFAYDPDPNDRVIYQLYLEPDGIQINEYTGVITVDKNHFSPVIEFFASASDRARQIVYTKIKILFPIQPKFSSNLYHISLLPSVQIPSEIFHFQLVDSFNQPLSFPRFEMDHTNFLTIYENRLILKDKLPSSKIFYFNVYGYWKNYTCQTSIQIIFVEKIMKLTRKSYEFLIEKNQLKDNDLIQNFEIKDSLLKILSTPLTINNCIRNFHLKYNQLYFQKHPILSNLCFFELQISDEKSISSSLIKISFIDPDFKPIFSSNVYHLYTNHLRIFAKSLNPVRYKLQANPYGLVINQTSGVISLKNRLDQIQLFVYAFDDKTGFNDTALIKIIPNPKKEFELPQEISPCPHSPMSISDQTLPGTIIQNMNNKSNQYYILSGDKYGLFSIDDLGKIYLVSSILNRTTEEYFELIILQSSFSISFCSMNISIIRLPRWSYFICPPMPIEWLIEEESPIGTRIGNVKDILLNINNHSQLINQIQMKLDQNPDTQSFQFNPSTGLILSKSRLDYEDQSFYAFSILLKSITLHCSLHIRIKLINIDDNPISFDQKSLIYTINDNHPLPFYLGRIGLINLDPIYSSRYRYFLMNSSSDISIDETTGSIILLSKFTRDRLQYEIIVSNGKNISDILRINIFPLKIKDLTLSIDSNEEMNYFNLESIHRCLIDKNQLNGTRICTIGKNSMEFIYQIIDPMNLFEILSNNGTIISRKRFNHQVDNQDFNVTIVVCDRKNQSIVLYSLNLTIYLRNLNDQPTDFTTLLYLFYPSMNTTVYTLEEVLTDPSNFTYEILNDTFSGYNLRISPNSTELILIQSILHNREDYIIIRRWNVKNHFFDVKFRLIYLNSELKFPTILSQTIDGYLNLNETSSNINLGQLFLHNHDQYQFIYFHLIPHQYFSLQQLSNNRTDLYFHSFPRSSFGHFQIDLIAIALSKSIPDIDFSKKTKIFFPSITKSQSINIHLRSINHEMLDRTVSFIVDLNTTYEQFILYRLPIIRQDFARMTGVNTDHVHIYTFEIRDHQIEFLFAILRSTTRHYMHKKFLLNLFKNTSNIFDPCQSNSCENNAYCASYIRLLDNQYTYFYSNIYQRVLPKYQWNQKCLCRNSYYGDRCQFRQEKHSPCSSNPCLPMEKCFEESSTSYTCQCNDELCYRRNSFNCININSPTCRDSSNTLTFDGQSSIRMNSTNYQLDHINIKFSFRSYLSDGKLFQLIYTNKKSALDYSIVIRMIDGYIKIEFNNKILLQLNDILINDGLWHDLIFSIDDSTYLLRLDHVFTDKIILSQTIDSNPSLQFIIGSDYYGCMGNLSLNNEIIPFEQENENNNSIEFLGTRKTCQIPEIIDDDLCSLYNPCYHGGICFNHDELSFTCNCTNRRFTGRQCQIDLYPCQSHPCQNDEQCISLLFDTNQSYQCIRLSRSTKKSLYIGLIFILSLCIFLMIWIYYFTKRRDEFMQDAPFVSAPLLIQQAVKRPDGTMQTLVKSEYRLSDPKYYSTIEQTNTPVHYSSIDYGNTNIPPPADPFECSSVSMHNQRNHQIHINSVSDVTENFDETEFDLTESLNDSSMNNQNQTLGHYDQIPRSTLSLPKGPIYARIVKTAKVRHMLCSTPTSFVKPHDTDDELNESSITRPRHASDSDLLNGRKFSSFFQTDV